MVKNTPHIVDNILFVAYNDLPELAPMEYLRDVASLWALAEFENSPEFEIQLRFLVSDFLIVFASFKHFNVLKQP
uniref:Uncharacterized protein n=1 Tax=Panagrolaimus superbus TaxID=310955 RepID=A0A914Z9A7_9BILA